MSKNEVAAALTEFVEAKSKGNDSLVCKVISVDLPTNTCYCEPINGDSEIQNVKLTTNITGAGVGFLLIPKINSLVVVSFLDNSSAQVSMVAEVDEVNINGKTLGGLVKVIDLTTKLNNLENKVNAIISTFNSHVHVTACAAGAGTANTTVAPVVGTLTPTVRADVENILIKQGDGT